MVLTIQLVTIVKRTHTQTFIHIYTHTHTHTHTHIYSTFKSMADGVGLGRVKMYGRRFNTRRVLFHVLHQEKDGKRE